MYQNQASKHRKTSWDDMCLEIKHERACERERESRFATEIAVTCHLLSWTSSSLFNHIVYNSNIHSLNKCLLRYSMYQPLLGATYIWYGLWPLGAFSPLELAWYSDWWFSLPTAHLCSIWVGGWEQVPIDSISSTISPCGSLSLTGLLLFLTDLSTMSSA